ncbi:hypothetical protein ACOME3_010114 [Neoechinorhynchus agilis]
MSRHWSYRQVYVVLIISMLMFISFNECENSPLTSWCLSKNFLYNIDSISTQYPTHYRYCTTKAATCRKLYQLGDLFRSKYLLNHTDFFQFCRFVNGRSRFTRSRPPNLTPRRLIINTNVVIDSTVVDFLYYVFGLKYKSLMDTYINDIFKAASNILTEGLTNLQVSIHPTSISHVSLMKYDRGVGSQTIYNEWCDQTHKVLSIDEINRTHLHIIMSKVFSKLTDHVG